MNFFENLGGFLVHPSKQIKLIISNGNISKQFFKSTLFILYSSIVLSSIMFFFILYPECLYYGINGSFQNLQFINLSTPIILLIFFLFGVFLYVIFYYFGIGSLNYLILNFFFRKRHYTKNIKEYFTIYSYSFIPLIIFGLITIFWSYFGEKLYIATEIFPYIDFTPLNIIYLTLYFISIIWRLIVEFIINQNYFQISFFKSLVPEIIEFSIVISLLVLISYLIGFIGGSNVWV